MSKNILILSSSPRRNGNSDMLCNEFMRGAQEVGNQVEKIFLRDKKINFCNGCDVCSSENKPCPQNDDANEISNKMVAADVIVFGSPVYFYAMSAQMKTLLDRCCGPYTQMRNKEFYLMLAAAETDQKHFDMVVENFKGFFECLENPMLKGVVYGNGAWHKGEMAGNKAMQEAYEMGKTVQ